ncbi:MAG TPA: sigma 54-interacting transcriptional regulator [Terriglobales bacterium]|nr:sigma 54-interacting transcriptional regulator [Terriglobales bacterium]
MSTDSTTETRLVDGTTLIFRSEAMRKLITMVERVARHEATVLIAGETGSGKEMIGRAIHEQSLRCAKPFVDVNCAAFPEHLVESELFGYEKGAFSGAEATKPGLFELANQGTLFLDEIGELDARVQAKLLRVLDGAPYYRLGGSNKVSVNVRVVAATNRDLKEEVQLGKFRRDLYHRLAQFELHVPSLRERTQDIVPIAEHFLQQQCPGLKFAQDALDALEAYHWPGNVRELKNVILRTAVGMEPDATEIRAWHLPGSIYGSPAPLAAGSGNLEELERQMILQATSQNEGSQLMAAQKLGISVRTLRRKLSRYKQEIANDGSPSLGKLSSFQQRYYRVSQELPITLQYRDKEIHALTVNVSSGGVAMRCPVHLAHDALLGVSFKLDESKSPITCKAKLAWSGPGGLVGLNFVEIHPAFQRELHHWLTEKAQAEGWMEASAGR